MNQRFIKQAFFVFMIMNVSVPGLALYDEDQFVQNYETLVAAGNMIKQTLDQCEQKWKIGSKECSELARSLKSMQKELEAFVRAPDGQSILEKRDKQCVVLEEKSISEMRDKIIHLKQLHVKLIRAQENYNKHPEHVPSIVGIKELDMTNWYRHHMGLKNKKEELDDAQAKYDDAAKRCSPEVVVIAQELVAVEYPGGVKSN
jgi:hypothetical protein